MRHSAHVMCTVRVNMALNVSETSLAVSTLSFKKWTLSGTRCVVPGLWGDRWIPRPFKTFIKVSSYSCNYFIYLQIKVFWQFISREGGWNWCLSWIYCSTWVVCPALELTPLSFKMSYWTSGNLCCLPRNKRPSSFNNAARTRQIKETRERWRLASMRLISD